jgi:cobalamin biosynthesis protein CobD/CbiB
MNAIAEIAIAAVTCLIEISITITRYPFAPIRYLISGRYRFVVQERWRGQPSRRTVDFIGGTLALLLFISMVLFWALVLRHPEQPSKAVADADLAPRLIDSFLRRPGNSK